MAKLPRAFVDMTRSYPKVAKAYESFGKACFKGGPLDRKTAELVKLAIAVGAGLEGGVHSHARRALEAGATADEVRHVAILGFTTIGVPASMAGLTWMNDVVGGSKRKS